MDGTSDDLDRVRERLLDALLPHVVFDGWSEAALLAGARDLKLDAGLVMAAFPGGPAEAARAFSELTDRRMLEAVPAAELAEMRVRDRVSALLRVRLQLLAPHKEAIRRLASFLALPNHAALGARLAWRTCDAIWYAAGDTATDYNWYSKRSLLFGVHSATLLYWLNDRSEGDEETFAFLERRLDEVLRIGGKLGKGMGRLLDLPDRLFRRRFRPGMRMRVK
ncbi:MAG: COQ9 family protein [Tistlia sp.]|uniref:COQ9 family protein n=1 Tax=Tistlia sp. TaxID=3057121 RepID=UPI0034A5B15F